MAGPVITKVMGWLFPSKKPEPVPPAPVVPPDAPPVAVPEPPVITPSSIQFVNYLRALAILRKLPLKQLRAEFLKLPLRQLLLGIGVAIWLYMTYLIVNWLLLD